MTRLHHFVLVISYDGTDYFGLQKTQEGPSIEEELTKVLETIFQENILLNAASRTDKGVHAECQVVDFFASRNPFSTNRLRTSLNQLLPKSIVCKEIYLIDFPFHPTTDALEKTYRYIITDRQYQLPFERYTQWHIYAPSIDRKLLQESCSFFIGTKDFTGFANQHKDFFQKDPVRTISDVKIFFKDSTIEIRITGKSFLYKMVRNIVGTMVYYAQKKISAETIEKIFLSNDRTYAGITAPAHGLSLLQIHYSGFFSSIKK